MGRGCPIECLHLDWALPRIVANGKVVVFVKEFVVSIAHVSLAARAELCCALRASGLSFHSFLARNSKAADIPHFNLFTGLEIRAQGWGCNWRRSRNCDRSGGSGRSSLGFCLGLCLWLRSCFRFGFVFGFHG